MKPLAPLGIEPDPEIIDLLGEFFASIVRSHFRLRGRTPTALFELVNALAVVERAVIDDPEFKRYGLARWFELVDRAVAGKANGDGEAA